MKTIINKKKITLNNHPKKLYLASAVIAFSLLFQNCGGEFKATDLEYSSSYSSALPDTKVGPATLSWDANIESDLIGYKIYYGTSANKLDRVIGDIGKTATPKAPSFEIKNLSEGMTYYFAVTAYSSDCESAQSQVVSKTIQ